MKTSRYYWPTIWFFAGSFLVALIGLPLYFAYTDLPLPVLIFAVIFAALTNLSITAGYHRLFAHKSYEAHPLVRLAYLLIGASAWQGSALKWSSDHRVHHAKVDSDEDPYSIQKGFWHAHMGWLFLKETVDKPIHAPDLQRDPMVAWQDRHFIPLAIFMSFGLPTLVGLIWNAPLAGFLFGGVARVLLTQQSTFFVNSLSHTLGRRTYSSEITARDSVVVALLTHGEGYHNFHHRFQADYRNGVRWYQWDPTKWTIRMLALLGLARKLRRISDQEILRARLQAESLRLRAKGYSAEKLDHLRQQILSAQDRMRQGREELRQLKKDMSEASRLRLEQVKSEFQAARRDFKMQMRQWRRLQMPGHFSQANGL